jgi:hypothetical protein
VSSHTAARQLQQTDSSWVCCVARECLYCRVTNLGLGLRKALGECMYCAAYAAPLCGICLPERPAWITCRIQSSCTGCVDSSGLLRLLSRDPFFSAVQLRLLLVGAMHMPCHMVRIALCISNAVTVPATKSATLRDVPDTRLRYGMAAATRPAVAHLWRRCRALPAAVAEL